MNGTDLVWRCRSPGWLVGLGMGVRHTIEAGISIERGENWATDMTWELGSKIPNCHKKVTA